MKYCVLCNPLGNGVRGEEGTEAVGKYYLPPGKGHYNTGWIPVCRNCADGVSKYYEVVPLKGFEDHPSFKQENAPSGPYQHEWRKVNLVTQEDHIGGYDLWKCKKCEFEAKHRGLGRPSEAGCTVEGEALGGDE